jgi:hypothetical protein
MPDNSTCILLGKRRTGKTTVTLDILYHKRKLPCGVVISGTEESNHSFKGIVPDTFIYGEYDPKVIERIFARQKKLISRNLSKQEANETTGIVDPKVFIVLDDVMYDKSIWKSEVIRKVFFNGRHFQMFFMATCQYLMDLPPAIRANLDYTFILREPILNQRVKIHQYFCGIVPDFKVFCSVLDETTSNFECLVVDNTSRSTNITDVLFWYKAKIRPIGSWQIGSNQFWKHHMKTFNKDHDADEGDETKPSTKITVSKMR